MAFVIVKIPIKKKNILFVFSIFMFQFPGSRSYSTTSALHFTAQIKPTEIPDQINENKSALRA